MLKADLHKLGGIEAIVSLLDDNSSDAVRADAAFALGIAASSNEPFIVELTQRGGDDVMLHFVEVQRLLHGEDPKACTCVKREAAPLLRTAHQTALMR